MPTNMNTLDLIPETSTKRVQLAFSKHANIRITQINTLINKYNIDAPLFLTQLLLNKLSNGRVLNISSGAAHFPVTGWAAYCVSKAALSMLTRCWQLESSQIAFASVMPGIIDTSMQAKIRSAKNMSPEKLDFFKRLKQDNLLLAPATVAAFLCWLLLDIDTSNYVSKEWDIYDTSHHSAWLVPPNIVPALE